MTDEKARNLVSAIEQLLMQREHKEADFVAAKALSEAEARGRREEREACLTALRDTAEMFYGRPSREIPMAERAMIDAIEARGTER